jgi:hypothetical protein
MLLFSPRWVLLYYLKTTEWTPARADVQERPRPTGADENNLSHLEAVQAEVISKWRVYFSIQSIQPGFKSSVSRFPQPSSRRT